MKFESLKEAFLFAIKALDWRVSASTATREKLWPFLPMVVVKVPGVKGRLIPLNRDFQPLGISSERWEIAADYQWLHILEDEPVAARGRFWLFNDDNSPWRSRKGAERLVRLLKLLLDPGLDLTDTNGEAFKLLAEDRDNRMAWGLEEVRQ